MSNNSLVSVIVTCYNQGRFLQDALNSILNQTYTYWECLIIDDGSTDDTKLIASGYCQIDTRFNYHYKENGGVSSARNFGLSKVKGDYIQFLDADDFIELSKLEYQVSLLIKNDLIDITYGSSRFFFDEDKSKFYPIHYYYGGIPCDLTFKDKYQVEMLIKGNICTNCAPLFRKKVFDKIKFQNVVYEDWILNIECALNKFLFSFDNNFSAYSYIRMSADSQMVRHTAKNIKKNQSNLIIKSLMNQYQYTLVTRLFSHKKPGLIKKIKTSFKVGLFSFKNRILNKSRI